MTRFFLLIFILFQIGCESNRFESWNEMKNKIIYQESEIESLKELVSQKNDNYSQLTRDINNLKKKIDTESQRSDKEIESRIYSIPIIPQINKVDLSRLMGEKLGFYEVELINVEDIEFTETDHFIDFQLTLSTKSLRIAQVMSVLCRKSLLRIL